MAATDRVTLLLIRHAQPVTGADPALTPDGQAQAAELAEWLARTPASAPVVLYTSPMRRAVETAEPMATRLRIPILVDARLVEFDDGATSYVPLEQSPEVRAALWTALQTGELGPLRFDPDAFEHRVRSAFTDIIAAHAGSTVAVVCHGGVINSYVGAVLERPRGMFFHVRYTSITELRVIPAVRTEVVSLNETPHLHWAAGREQS